MRKNSVANVRTYLHHFIIHHKFFIVSYALSVLAVYINTIRNEFVSDDIASIVTNPNLGNFFYNLIHSHPTIILHSLIFTLSGTKPLLYHLNSIFWHLGVCSVLYAVLYLLSRNKMFSAVTTLLFAIHPIHTEAVTWISGLPYVLYTFFGLSTVLIVILIDKGYLNRHWLIVGIITMYLSLISSEKAIILPIIIVFYFFLLSSWKKSLMYWPLMLPAIYFSFIFFSRLGGRVAVVNPSYQGPPTVYNPLIQLPIAITSYLRLLLWPMNLTLYHEDLSFTWNQLYIYALIALLYIGLIIFLYKRNRLLCFLNCIFIIGLLPTLLPIQISWIVAERYVYFSSLGIIAFTAWILVWLKSKNKQLFFVFFLCLMTFYSVLTIKRNTDWKSQDTLWPATLTASPTSSRALNNMGDYYGRHGDINAAIGAFTRAIQIHPNYTDAMHNLGRAYLEIGQATKAAQMFQRVLDLDPLQLQSNINLASIYLGLNKYQEAKYYLSKAEEADPDSALVYNAWGIYYYKTGQKTKAVTYFQRALEIEPNFRQAIYNLNLIQPK